MRRLLFTSILLTALAMVSCAPQPTGSSPWAYQPAEGWQYQIMHGEQVVADIRLGGLEFSGAEAAQAVNRWLGELQEAKLAEFRAFAEQYFADLEFNGTPIENQIYYLLEESLSVFHNDGITLSIVVDEYVYRFGEPHPTSCRYAHNFDAATGKHLELEDIWGDNAREKAAREIYAQLEREARLGDYYSGLAGLLVQNLTPYDWYMDDKYFYIIYNPYEIAPYAMGVQEFRLDRE